jgi:hypothetical protein
MLNRAFALPRFSQRTNAVIASKAKRSRLGARLGDWRGGLVWIASLTLAMTVPHERDRRFRHAAVSRGRVTILTGRPKYPPSAFERRRERLQ